MDTNITMRATPWPGGSGRPTPGRRYQRPPSGGDWPPRYPSRARIILSFATLGALIGLTLRIVYALIIGEAQ